MCTRIKGANRGVSEGKLISGHGLLSFFEGHQGVANGQESWGVFRGWRRLWTAGCWLARRLHQLKASTTMDLGISIFHFLHDEVWPARETLAC